MTPLEQAARNLCRYYFIDAEDDGGISWETLHSLVLDLQNELGDKAFKQGASYTIEDFEEDLEALPYRYMEREKEIYSDLKREGY